ncbi:hypothetical protein BT69DRAFT_1330788 [Atractiella rhizophila]|nr:hypothetical protein BT69DRAFT_1330788 [Atractiella rhizophila]
MSSETSKENEDNSASSHLYKPGSRLPPIQGFVPYQAFKRPFPFIEQVKIQIQRSVLPPLAQHPQILTRLLPLLLLGQKRGFPATIRGHDSLNLDESPSTVTEWTAGHKKSKQPQELLEKAKQTLSVRGTVKEKEDAIDRELLKKGKWSTDECVSVFEYVIQQRRLDVKLLDYKRGKKSRFNVLRKAFEVAGLLDDNPPYRPAPIARSVPDQSEPPPSSSSRVKGKGRALQTLSPTHEPSLDYSSTQERELYVLCFTSQVEFLTVFQAIHPENQPSGCGASESSLEYFSAQEGDAEKGQPSSQETVKASSKPNANPATDIPGVGTAKTADARTQNREARILDGAGIPGRPSDVFDPTDSSLMPSFRVATPFDSSPQQRSRDSGLANRNPISLPPTYFQGGNPR